MNTSKIGKPPVDIQDGGSVVIIRPQSAEVWEWVNEFVQIPDYMHFGGGFACERRYAFEIVEAIYDEFPYGV